MRTVFDDPNQRPWSRDLAFPLGALEANSRLYEPFTFSGVACDKNLMRKGLGVVCIRTRLRVVYRRLSTLVSRDHRLCSRQAA